MSCTLYSVQIYTSMCKPFRTKLLYGIIIKNQYLDPAYIRMNDNRTLAKHTFYIRKVVLFSA